MDQRALLFTDVVDSTALVQRLGDAASSALWVEHDRRARALLATHAGQEIDRSDGFFLLFGDIERAARYAVAYHDAVRELGLAARVGLHVGPVILRRNAAADVARGAKPVEAEGLAKPLAARIMSLARGGQTLMSEPARDALAASLPNEALAGAQIDRHGHYRLKGVDEPILVFELGGPGDAFTPPADTDKAYRVVRAEGLWAPVREVRHNLAPERDAFVGRTGELRTLKQGLDGGCRLLTLVGVGGTGKTRTVCRYGRAWLGDWPGGVYFCDLSEARSREGIHFAVALALSVPLGKGDPSLQLGNAIAGRGRCLVILDNFEQVIAHAPVTLGHWMDRAADAAFLVTSRERLHLPGEAVLEIEPLSLADEAIELFAVRAQAQQAGFAVGDANRAAVARVVELLDGLPLAIELAAARIRIMSPQQILQRLQDRFRLLAGARGPAARQPTLKAAIDWSWDLLQPWEQAALAQCSVFEGGFTLDAAEAVLDVKRWPEASPVMDVVQALADKSLLRRAAGRLDIDEPHFAMYLSIHEYAADKLHAGGGTLGAHSAHGAYFARFGSDEAIEALYHQGGVGRTRALALEIDNLVAACRRAAQRGDAQTAVPAYRAAGEVLGLQGPFATGLALGAQVTAMQDLSASLRADACATLGRLMSVAGRLQDADGCFGQAIAQARIAGDAMRELSGMWRQADGWRMQGRMDEARAQFEAALPRIREPAHLRLRGSTLGSLGGLHYQQGRMEDARTWYEQAFELHRQIGNRRGEASALTNLGVLHFEQSRFEEAATHYAQSAVIQQEVGNRVSAALSLENLGVLHERQGRYIEAQQQFETALAIYREAGARRHEGGALDSLGLIRHRQHDLVGARPHMMAAMEIYRETGNLRSEGIGLCHLGNLDGDEGRLEDGVQRLEQSVDIFRRIGDRYSMAVATRDLANLLSASQRLDEASGRLDEAEAMLRELRDEYELGITYCHRGRLLIAQGHPDRARTLLASAQATALTLSATGECNLGCAIAELCEALA